MEPVSDANKIYVKNVSLPTKKFVWSVELEIP